MFRQFLWYILIAIGILILITAVFLGFNRPKATVTNKVTNKKVTLSDYSNSDASVSYMIVGITNGDEMHRAIKISVNKNSRNLQIYQGYQGKVLQSYSYSNNSSAYKEFLAGLQTMGYLNQSKKPTNKDIFGQCPLGYKYLFNTSGVANVPNYLWTSNCAASPGTFGGKLTSVQRLFQLQIPKYSSLVSGVNLSASQ